MGNAAQNDGKRKLLGQMLVEANLIDEIQLTVALGAQNDSGLKLGKQLLKLGFVEEGDLAMFLKDETADPPAKNIRIATAEKPQGPYTRASKPITGDYWAEGPSAIKIDDTWFVYFDQYRKHNYGVVISKDLESWRDVSDKLVFPKGSRHGTILQISNQVLDGLLKAK